MENNTIPQEDVLPRYAISFSWGDFIVQPSHLRRPTFDIVSPDLFKRRSIADPKKKADQKGLAELVHLLMDEDIVGAQYVAYKDYYTAHKHWSNLNKYILPFVKDIFARKVLKEVIESLYLLRKHNIMLMKAHLAQSVYVGRRTPHEVEKVQQTLLDLFVRALHMTHIHERNKSLGRAKRKIEKSQRT